jgi:hypothetical protein
MLMAAGGAISRGQTLGAGAAVEGERTPVREEGAAMTEYSNTTVKPDTIERLKDSAQSERCGGPARSRRDSTESPSPV